VRRGQPYAPILGRFAGRRVWVVGDVMLDEYLRGRVDRISPEAPVPVVTIIGRERRPGGAANVAHQLARLGAVVELAGVVGSDEAGRDVLAHCDAAGIGTSAVEALPGRPTTQKLRVLGHGQQVVRLDWEEPTTPAGLAETLLGHLAALPPPEIVVVSDYAKGVVSPDLLASLIGPLRARHVPVLVDPKSLDLSRYRHASVVTPNLRELEAAARRVLHPTALPAIADAARELARTAGLEAIVVTLGEHGMLVVPRDGGETAIPGMRRPVYDVTGAGDTAIAVLALALAAGAPLPEAATIANAAAGCTVSKVGAVAVEREEILAALSPNDSPVVLDRTELASRVRSWRLAGKRIVFTNGCFDLLHIGHLSLLQRAASFGDVLVVAINGDASVRRLKGPERPLVPATERAAMLAALDCVDAVTVFDEDTPEETIRAILPDVLVKGQDYRLSDVVGRALVEAHGGRVELVQLVPDLSTSNLVERIRGASSRISPDPGSPDPDR
jgi:D-beta-D-heptose 7-phosphate kinase/D-beta-D-heptose 1-phosphate adenosyltransferase